MVASGLVIINRILKMKKIAIALCLAFGTVVGLNAQQAKNYFINMPDSILPLLTSVNRADCIDFLGSKMKAEVTNRFGAKSEMTTLSPDYIRIQMSAQSTWQMKLLTLNDTTKVICTLSTACAPVCDSKIRFYSPDWKELPTSKFLALPVASDFLSIPDTLTDYSVRDALGTVDLLLIKADLSPNDNKLAFTFTTPEYLGQATSDKIRPYIHTPLSYIWMKGKFQRE